MESNEILAENLKKYRVRYGMSQEELAHKSGFSTRSYYVIVLEGYEVSLKTDLRKLFVTDFISSWAAKLLF